ncbi:hypothetical protein [Proteus phage 3H10_20]|uniref:Uncharacterized protein n=1 Tax=Proteus phage 3H10_20 TaxID=2772448 RepID=A0A7L7SS59_9CAUD|nr:hypothetical protein PQC37_gp096 [Proteus phage 3H10_20]QOC54882.1 hypothetical protein [Proteus phage 3H10_20]
MSKYDAELKIEAFFIEERVVSGFIKNDTSTHGNHPFKDGTPVLTSRVESLMTDEDGDLILKTRNTKYKIVS